MKRDYLYIGAIAGLVIVIFFMDRCGEKREAKLRNEIAKQSGIIQEAEGRYTQLVTVTNSTNSLVKELQGSLDGQFDNIRKFLRKNDERLLAFTTAYASMRSKKDSVLIFPANPITNADWQFKLSYPDSTKPFIEYEGLIFAQSQRITGGWKFNKFPISFILTETSSGNWNARISAPEYFIIDSIETRALPPDKIASSKKFKFIGGFGAGYSFDSDSPIFSLNVGCKIKKMEFVMNGSTEKAVQLNICREF